jgi:hypothetical protein
MPDKEVWYMYILRSRIKICSLLMIFSEKYNRVSEFGYDSGLSTFRSPAYGPFSALQVQAMWIVRSYLALAAAGVDKAFLFEIRDETTDPNDNGIFATCGLTGSRSLNYPTKPSICYMVSNHGQPSNSL